MDWQSHHQRMGRDLELIALGAALGSVTAAQSIASRLVPDDISDRWLRRLMQILGKVRRKEDVSPVEQDELDKWFAARGVTLAPDKPKLQSVLDGIIAASSVRQQRKIADELAVLSRGMEPAEFAELAEKKLAALKRK